MTFTSKLKFHFGGGGRLCRQHIWAHFIWLTNFLTIFLILLFLLLHVRLLSQHDLLVFSLRSASPHYDDTVQVWILQHLYDISTAMMETCDQIVALKEIALYLLTMQMMIIIIIIAIRLC